MYTGGVYKKTENEKANVTLGKRKKINKK